jgi:hypothetical protein
MHPLVGGSVKLGTSWTVSYPLKTHFCISNFMVGCHPGGVVARTWSHAKKCPTALERDHGGVEIVKPAG